MTLVKTDITIIVVVGTRTGAVQKNETIMSLTVSTLSLTNTNNFLVSLLKLWTKHFCLTYFIPVSSYLDKYSKLNLPIAFATGKDLIVRTKKKYTKFDLKHKFSQGFSFFENVPTKIAKVSNIPWVQSKSFLCCENWSS